MLNQKTQLNISRHAEKRAMARGINTEQISLCIDYGDTYYRTGAIFFFMSKKCLVKLKNIYGSYLSKLDGIVVLARNTINGLEIITVYKNKDACKMIKKKQKKTNRRKRNAKHYN